MNNAASLFSALAAPAPSTTLAQGSSKDASLVSGAQCQPESFGTLLSDYTDLPSTPQSSTNVGLWGIPSPSTELPVQESAQSAVLPQNPASFPLTPLNATKAFSVLASSVSNEQTSTSVAPSTADIPQLSADTSLTQSDGPVSVDLFPLQSRGDSMKSLRQGRGDVQVRTVPMGGADSIVCSQNPMIPSAASSTNESGDSSQGVVFNSDGATPARSNSSTSSEGAVVPGLVAPGLALSASSNSGDSSKSRAVSSTVSTLVGLNSSTLSDAEVLVDVSSSELPLRPGSSSRQLTNSHQNEGLSNATEHLQQNKSRAIKAGSLSAATVANEVLSAASIEQSVPSDSDSVEGTCIRQETTDSVLEPSVAGGSAQPLPLNSVPALTPQVPAQASVTQTPEASVPTSPRHSSLDFNDEGLRSGTILNARSNTSPTSPVSSAVVPGANSPSAEYVSARGPYPNTPTKAAPLTDGRSSSVSRPTASPESFPRETPAMSADSIPSPTLASVYPASSTSERSSSIPSSLVSDSAQSSTQAFGSKATVSSNESSTLLRSVQPVPLPKVSSPEVGTFSTNAVELSPVSRQLGGESDTSQSIPLSVGSTEQQKQESLAGTNTVISTKPDSLVSQQAHSGVQLNSAWRPRDVQSFPASSRMLTTQPQVSPLTSLASFPSSLKGDLVDTTQAISSSGVQILGSENSPIETIPSAGTTKGTSFVPQQAQGWSELNPVGLIRDGQPFSNERQSVANDLQEASLTGIVSTAAQLPQNAPIPVHAASRSEVFRSYGIHGNTSDATTMPGNSPVVAPFAAQGNPAVVSTSELPPTASSIPSHVTSVAVVPPGGDLVDKSDAQLGEKSAAVSSLVQGRGESRRGYQSEKSQQLTNLKKEAKDARKAGIEDAHSAADMSTTVAFKASLDSSTGSRSAVDWVGSALSQLGAGDKSSSSLASAQLEPHAKQLVDRVEKALASLQENSERIVRFDVGDARDERLSVSMQLKNGVIHTTFVSGSTELRDVISREWTSSLAGSLGADAALRVAEPVFSTQGRNENLDTGGNSQRNQNQQQESSQGQASANQGGSFQRRSSSAPAIVSQPDTPVQQAVSSAGTRPALQAFA